MSQSEPRRCHTASSNWLKIMRNQVAFSEPGDAMLLQLPSYPPFMRAIEDTGRRLIANPMRDDGTRWVLDLGAYEAAHDPRLRMLIFCHP